MNRGKYILRRLVQMIPVLFGITIIVFFMVHLIPGDPLAVMLGDRATDQDGRRARLTGSGSTSRSTCSTATSCAICGR